jgi:phosphoglycerate kinase
MSHLGRPKGVEEKYSLKHILKTTSAVLGVQVKFVSDCIGQEAENAAAALKSGEVLLENLRFHSEEEAGGVAFAAISFIRRYLC